MQIKLALLLSVSDFTDLLGGKNPGFGKNTVILGEELQHTIEVTR